MNNTIKFAQINKGDSNFVNRVDQISEIIEKYSPHIIIINELIMKTMTQ